MEQIAALLKEHIDSHPGLETVDAVKFLFQSYLGPEHLVPSEPASLTRLEEELAQCGPDFGQPLTQPLGNGLCRLNLRPSQTAGLSPATLNRLFFLTARQFRGDRAAFEGALDQVRDFCLPGWPDFPADYRRRGCPAVRHSSAYRARYRPAYRVVLARFGALVPILAAIDRELARRDQVRLAIDGPCASGKSTLARTLADIYACPVIHMDDFFLQPHQRTPQRLEEPGGNVDYERFDAQVLSPLCRNEAARYRPWRCRTGDLGPELVIPPAPLVVFEGSYSLRPDLRERYHLRIWTQAPWDIRLERIAQRGPGCTDRFRQVWIPLEDRYFAACQVKECCQLVWNGDN